MSFPLGSQGPIPCALCFAWIGRAAPAIASWSLPGGGNHFYVTAAILFFAVETALIVVLTTARRRARRSSTLLERRFAIETVISRFSARLSSCPAGEVDSEIEQALRAIVSAEDIDVASWVVISSKSTSQFYATDSSAGLEAVIYPGPELPWVTEMLLQDEPVVIGSVEDLPDVAESDKLYFVEKSIKAAAFIPCGLDTGVRSILVLVRLRNELSWPKALVERLGVLGNLFANALMRKQAQQAGAESDKRFQYLFEEAPIGIAIENIDGKILFANPALCSILGYSPEEIVGMNCCEFSDPDEGEGDWRQFQELRAGRLSTYRVEKCYQRKDGAKIWGRVNVSLLKDAGAREPIVVATVEDITAARKATADLNHLNAELRQLTARLIQSQELERQRIARELHDDISQRLALLMMEIDAWQGEIPFQRTSDHSALRKIMAQLDELSTDIHNLSHQLHSTQLRHLGLRSALQELCYQFSLRHNVPIHLNVDDIPLFLPELVSLCFYRVAQEAIRNALKHSNSPRVEVALTVGEALLRMQIRDFGTGFDLAVPNSGLGLVTMQERLRMLGGTLRISSAPADGTEVVAEVPVERSSMAARVA